MTENEATIVTGTVDNGRTVEIAIKGYIGPAACRTRGAVLELAYLGLEPRSLPTPITVDGEAFTVTAKLKSLVRGMTLLHAVRGQA